MTDILKSYVQKFNKDDEECYRGDISNDDAYSWLRENIPLIECPDKTLEEIYYFRWWVYRKHIKSTPEGYIITEFLPDVPWATDFNAINAAAGFHLSEGKWLKNAPRYLDDYISFWLKRADRGYTYSMWLLSAIWDYCNLRGDYTVGVENIELMERYYSYWEREHLEPCGMFWSYDNNDAMEYTISGTSLALKRDRGFRPTLNSYMAADAFAISRFARLAKKDDIAEKYEKKGARLRALINEKLWDGDFFKSYHITDESGNLTFEKMPPERNVRELVGYIPWCFTLADEGKECAFSYLKRSDGFKSPYGLTTAEQNHPRFCYEVNHECLWNGYIWPYATSQTLRACGNLLHNYKQTAFSKEDFYDILRGYAKMQYITASDNSVKPWIDEVKDPRDGSWSSREWLRARGWIAGGYERGKDYNHSAFCDHILGDLFGIRVKNGRVTAEPLVPEKWKYFTVRNLFANGKIHSITYDGKNTKICEEQTEGECLK